MSSSSRYAIYFMPRFDLPLWREASQWLGRDASSDQLLEHPASAVANVAEVTASPRFYGFHATLKAPFELVSHLREEHLLAHAEVVAAQQQSFEIELGVKEIGNFLALCLTEKSPPMQDLHRASVTEFDVFRAPLTEFDKQRRRFDTMPETQKALFLGWGYPYVFEEFRFHMTLTGSIKDESLRRQLFEELQHRFPHSKQTVDGIAVCYQPDRETPFKVLQRFQFA